jgi:hypothetical protein
MDKREEVLNELRRQETNVDPPIPLATFLQFPFEQEWSDVCEESKNRNDIIALKATYECLKELDSFSPPPNIAREWNTRKKNLQIGFTQKTKSFGNSSIAMGLAEEIFREQLADESSTLHDIRLQYFLFLHCHKQGIEFQVYRHGIQGTYCILEEKGLIFNYPMELYNPEALQEQIEFKVEKMKKKWEASVSFRTFAFVTTSSRTIYYECDKEETKKQMNASVRSIFAKVAEPWNADGLFTTEEDSFFIPHDIQAKCEWTAIQTMYGNMFPNFQVVSPFSIKERSCHFCSFTAFFGMDHPKEVEQDLAMLFKEQFSRSPLAQHFYELMFVPSDGIPVIALESWAGILLDENATLRRKLMDFHISHTPGLPDLLEHLAQIKVD